MITVRKSAERGHFNHGWLESYHTFSFADYFDRNWMRFSDLRVMNEDVVQPGQGFGTHPHRDMEIITYVLSGSLEHKDSMGNGSIIKPGEVQYMSAGSGVTHSEFNHSKTEPVHLYQIWILPNGEGLKPQYDQKSFRLSDDPNSLKLLASEDGRDGSIAVRQDIRLMGGLLTRSKTIEFAPKVGRSAWLQVARGEVELNGLLLKAGDGAAVAAEGSTKSTGVAEALEITGGADQSEILLFDLN